MAFTARQQELRGQYLGGSEIAAVLGLSQYDTPFDVWYKKTLIRNGGAVVTTHEERPKDDSARLGELLEPVIRTLYVEKHPGHRIEEADLVLHPTHPFVGATPDGLIVMPDAGLEALAEIKTKSWRTAKDFGDSGTDEVPDDVLCQVQWSLFATGKSLAKILVLVDGRDYREYVIEARPALHEDMLEVAHDFWHHRILTNTPPDEKTGERATAWLQEKFKLHGETIRPASYAERTQIKLLVDAKAQYKALEAEIERLGNIVREAIGEDAGIQSPEAKVTWKKTKDAERVDNGEVVADLLSETEALIAAYYAARGVQNVAPMDEVEFVRAIVRQSIQRYTRTVPGGRRFLVTPRKEGK